MRVGRGERGRMGEGGEGRKMERRGWYEREKWSRSGLPLRPWSRPHAR